MAVNLGTAYAELKVKTQGFSQGLKQAESDLSSFQKNTKSISKGFSDVGASLTKTGKTLTTAVTLPLMGLATAAVKTTATFDSSMSKVQALSGATGEDLEALRQKALEMGATTSFSASEAADALGYMALAGWDTQQMLDALPGVLDLAAASGMGLAEASDMVTDYLSAFGLEAADATKMSNEMAYAQSHSNTSTQQLGEAFGNCAAQMNTAGQTMETTTAFLEAMANQGTKGSEAGTALAAVMRDITQKMEDGAIAIGDTNVQVVDQEGNFRSLIDIMADVEKATEGMGTAEKSAALMQTFTARSIKAVSESLTEGTDNIRGYEEALHDVDGVASDMSKTMLKNLNGQLKLLMSALESLAIQIGDILMPYISQIVEKIQSLVEAFTALDDSQKEQILKWAGIVAAIGPILLIFGKLATAIGAIVKLGGTLVNTFGLVGGASAGASGGLGAMAASIGSMAAAVAAAIAIIVGLGVALKSLYDLNGEFKASVDSLVETMQNNLANVLQTVAGALQFLWEKLTAVYERIRDTVDIEALDRAMGGLVDSIGNLMTALQPVIQFIGGVLLGTLAQTVVPLLLLIPATLNAITRGLEPLIKTITSAIDVVTDAFNVISELIEGLTTGDFTGLVEAVEKLVEDVLKLEDNLVETIVKTIGGFIEGIAKTIDEFTGGMITKVVEFFRRLFNDISDFFTITIPEEFNKFMTVTLPNFIEECKLWFEKFPYNLGYAIGTALSHLKSWGIDVINWVKEKIPEIIENIVKFFSELPGKIKKWLEDTISKITSWGTDMWNKATEIAQGFIDNMVDLIKTLPDKIWEWISGIPGKILEAKSDMEGAGSGLFNSLWDGMKSVWNSITGWFNSVLDAVSDFVSDIMDGMADAEEASEGSHADGLAYVPYNGYRATLHEGERVLTKNEAAEYNSGSKTSGNVFNFYSPKAIDAYEANRQFENTIRKMEEGFL